MKICVVGAGSIGGFLGVKLHNLGEDVSLIARGEHLAAIRENGLKLIMKDGTQELATGICATSDMRNLDHQDLVILGVKSHQIEPIVDDLNSLLGPNSVLMTIQNGIPWWYFQKHGGQYDGRPIQSVDPDGRIATAIDPKHILGCIAYPAAGLCAPGVIQHVEGNRFPIGELDGSVSQRAQDICEMLRRAGMKSSVIRDFRSEIWLKLWGNVAFNPISALTHSTLVDICRYPQSRQLAATMMEEAQNTAAKLGVTFRVSLERRIAGAENVGKHKTSMLQDVEAGKGLEIDGIVGAVAELGELTGTPTPCIRAVHGLLKLLDKTLRDDGVCIKAKPLNSA